MVYRTGQGPSNEENAGGLAGQRRFAPCVALIVGIAIEAVLIRQMSGHGDFLQKGEGWKFTLFGMAAGSAYWIAAACFKRLMLTARQKACIFWLTAVLLRVLILPVTPGDDVWRYRWEGMVQLHGFNPYQSGPDSPELVALRNADWAKINHRDYPAIYPPLTEAVFAAVAAGGNALWLYKALFALADLAGIAVLRRLLVRSGLAAERAAWYAWNPLVIYAFAGAAHFDSLMILALLGAIWALDGYVSPPVCLEHLRGVIGSHPRKGNPVFVPGSARAPRAVAGAPPATRWPESAARAPQTTRGGACAPRTTRQTFPAVLGSESCGWSALLLGVAIAIKIAPLALLPVWMFAIASRRRVLVLLPVVFAPLGISALIYGFPGVPVFSTLREFGRSFRVNDPFWWIVEAARWFQPSENNVRYGIVGATICAALAYRFRRDWRRGMLWVWGAALILSPVVHAWYVVWVLPLAAWRGDGARVWFVFSISSFGYFLLWEVNHASGKPWEEPLWLRLVILLPPLLYLAWTRMIRLLPDPVVGRIQPIEFPPREDDRSGR